MLFIKGIGINSLAEIAVAMVKEAEESDEKELIQQLEGMIEELKQRG